MGDAAVHAFEGSFVHYLVLSLDIAGTFAFAVSGASAGAAQLLQLNAAVTAALGAAACFALRMAAIRYRWRLPVSKATQKPR